MKALTVREPWGWLIVNGYKDIENRSWPTKMRGRIWIHSSARKVTKDDYEYFLEICRKRKIKKYPGIDEFKRGGIIGSAEIVDCVDRSRSFWFGGEYGFVQKNARKCRFRPMKGMLGFFDPKAARKWNKRSKKSRRSQRG